MKGRGMADDRFERGVEYLRKVRGDEAVDAMLEGLNSRSPRFAQYSISTSFGEVYPRDGLEDKIRELVTIAILATLGDTASQLQTHVDIGLKMGLEPVEIVETIVQVAAYAGAPRSSQAMRAISVAFESAGVQAP